jgi:hypothetical protein
MAKPRVDDWLMEETPIKFPVAQGISSKDAARPAKAQITKKLQLADAEHRITETEATVTRLKETFLKDKKAWEEKKAADLEKIKAAGSNK